MPQQMVQRIVQNIRRFAERGERPTEAATKHALVLPFISDVLGADYSNLDEVIPEYTADIGQRKGEKVDYAICRNGKPVILIECKALHTTLDDAAIVQLRRYVNSRPDVNLGVLTDGQHYHFFADLDAVNILDTDPFLSIDLLKLNPTEERQLQLFHLGRLDVEAIKEEGRGWKTVASLVQTLENEWREPSDGYVTYFAKSLHREGPLTESVRRRYAGYLKEAHRIFLSRHIDSNPISDTEINTNQEKERSLSGNSPSIITPPDRWRSLTELNPTEPAPRAVRFEDGEIAEVKNWADLVRTVSCKLASEGYFRPVPYNLDRIIREKPPNTITPWLKLPDGQYIRDSGSATDRLNISMRLLTASGFNPAKCTVK